MLPLLSLLNYAPAVFSAGQDIYKAFTGKQAPADPGELAGEIEALPTEQREAVTARIIEAKAQIQHLDTQRFAQLTDGTAEKIRSTARPEIALRSMAMMELFSQCFKWLIVATLIQVFANWLLQAFDSPLVMPSVWAEIAKAQPVAEMIWAPLLASFYAAIEIIKKYMGCRERDKAQEYEIRNGKPLQSSAATIEAAGGAISGLVKAWRSK